MTLASEVKKDALFQIRQIIAVGLATDSKINFVAEMVLEWVEENLIQPRHTLLVEARDGLVNIRAALDAYSGMRLGKVEELLTKLNDALQE